MVKFYEGRQTFKFTWDQVAQAFWARYPNPYSQHVLSEDVIFRKLEGGKLYSKRLLTKTNRVPKWGERFISSRAVQIVEESVVDPINKVMVTYTRNIGLRSVMTVEERCVYRTSMENAKWTVVDRQAWVASSLFGFARAIQAFGLERFKQNAVKACRGFQFVLEKMFQPGHSPETVPPLLMDRERLRETAKKATELAKSKAAPLVVACASNTQ